MVVEKIYLSTVPATRGQHILRHGTGELLANNTPAARLDSDPAKPDQLSLRHRVQQ